MVKDHSFIAKTISSFEAAAGLKPVIESQCYASLFHLESRKIIPIIKRPLTFRILIL